MLEVAHFIVLHLKNFMLKINRNARKNFLLIKNLVEASLNNIDVNTKEVPYGIEILVRCLISSLQFLHNSSILNKMEKESLEKSARKNKMHLSSEIAERTRQSLGPISKGFPFSTNIPYVNLSTLGIKLFIVHLEVRRYHSRGEHISIIDNPLVRDAWSRIPIIRASAIKGALRKASLKYVLSLNDTEKIITALNKHFRVFGIGTDISQSTYIAREVEMIKQIIGEDVLEKLKLEDLRKKYTKGTAIFSNVLLLDKIDNFSIFLDVLTSLSELDRRPRTGPVLFEKVNSYGKLLIAITPNFAEPDPLNAVKEDAHYIKELLSKQRISVGGKQKYGWGELRILKIEDIGGQSD